MNDEDLQRLLNRSLERTKLQNQRREQQMNLETEMLTKYKKKGIKIGGFVVAAVFAGVLIAQSSDVIQPGYEGVQFSLNGGLKKDVLTQGLKWHAPWIDVTQYPVSTETVYLTREDTKESPGNEAFDVNTSDGKSVEVDVVYSYHMEGDKLPHVFTKFRRQEAPAIEKSYIKTQLKTVMQSVTTEHSVLGVYTEERALVTKKIEDKLGALLKKDGMILENFAMSDVRPDKKTLVSLQKISDSQNHQEYLKREEKNKTQEAINNKIAAEGVKNVTIVNAEAQAQKTKIEADAQAEANKKLEQSLTPAIIQDNWIKKWNGQQPVVGGGSNSLIQLPADLLKK